MTIDRRTLLAALGAAGLAAPALARSETHEPAGRYVEVGALRLHYLEAGDGPAVVLLHGWPQTSHAWRGTIERLKGRFRLIAPDLRGIGRSDRPASGYDKRSIAGDVAGLIERLAGDRAAVVGHDMGGKAAWTLAMLRPERVSKLALVDCLMPGTENMDAAHGGAWHYGFHMAPDIPELLTRGRERDYIAAQIRAWSHVKDAVSDADLDEYAARYAEPGAMSAGFALYRALPEDARLAAALRDMPLEPPVMTIGGRQSVGGRLAAAIEPQQPGHRSVVIENCGHFVAEEAPEEFCGRLSEFLSA